MQAHWFHFLLRAAALGGLGWAACSRQSPPTVPPANAAPFAAAIAALAVPERAAGAVATLVAAAAGGAEWARWLSLTDERTPLWRERIAAAAGPAALAELAKAVCRELHRDLGDPLVYGPPPSPAPSTR
jgi:hypothetical protein